MSDSTSGYPVPVPSAGWFKQRLAALSTQIREVRALAQNSGRTAAAAAKAADDAAAAVAALTLPPSFTGYGPDTATIGAAAATWEDAGTSTTITPARDLEVLCLFGANMQASGVGGGTYGMLGVRATGGITVEPEYDQVLGTIKWANTTFSVNGLGVSILGTKRLVLPDGVATTLTLRRRRNLTTMAPTVSYAFLTVIPERWV